jgi:hypothetical protein
MTIISKWAAAGPSGNEFPLEFLFVQLGFGDYKFGELIEYLYKLDILLVFLEDAVVGETALELPLAVQDLIEIPRE